MDLGTNPNVYEDVFATSGCDLLWEFADQPLDLTGCTARFDIDETGQTFPMTLSISAIGDDAVTTFSLHLTPAQLAGLTPGTRPGMWAYQVRVVHPNGWVLPYGNGLLILA